MCLNKVLLVEDDESLRTVTKFNLQNAGYSVIACASGEAGLKQYNAQRPTVVITDVKMPGMSGYDLLKKITKENAGTLVIVVTAFGSIENAVEAMKLGAYDYISKPFDREQLLNIVNKAFKFKELQENSAKIESSAPEKPEPGIIGESEIMRKLFGMITRIGSSEATVLILGESGTGKEIVAKAIHHASVRTGGPFVAVNCAAIPRELMESELFGHVKGSFTGAISHRQGKFEKASNGTIFLDEIGDMPLELQPKLLRVLQEREIEVVGGKSKPIDVRVVAATNQNIEQAVSEGRFRADLYYRLAVVPVKIPPLRHRKEDIRLLAQHFLAKHGKDPKVSISNKAMAYLESYNWPGNVRELENTVEQMLALCPSSVIGEKDLPPRIVINSNLESAGILKLPDQGYSLEKLEKEVVLQALVLNQWNVSKAADFLQVPRHVLAYRMEKYEIVHPD
jgi:two-component system NtrC family response regulator